jgi:hypothetical protein
MREHQTALWLPEGYETVGEAARRLGVRRRVLMRLVREGKLRTYRTTNVSMTTQGSAEPMQKFVVRTAEAADLVYPPVPDGQVVVREEVVWPWFMLYGLVVVGVVLWYWFQS